MSMRKLICRHYVPAQITVKFQFNGGVPFQILCLLEIMPCNQNWNLELLVGGMVQIRKQRQVNTFYFLSLCPLFFIKFSFHTKWYPFKNYEKMFFISSKKLFSFSRYPNFCISVLPSFPLSAIALGFDRRKILKFITSSTV